MKDKLPQLELLHSLDIWHKAKKLSKCIHQAARVKGCESLKEWIDDIVSHFWFCCQNCEGGVGELKEVWFGVLHHVCGEHKWAEGECRHSLEETPSNGKTYLKRSSKALAALRKDWSFIKSGLVTWHSMFVSGIQVFLKATIVC